MTAHRMVARLAAICALNNFGAEPFPTLAGPFIFDSRIEAIEDTQEDKVYPLCVVYTDYDRDAWKHSSAIDNPRLLTLTFELLCVQKADNTKPFIDCPQTDSELEAAIDIFEDQIFKALIADNAAGDCFKYLVLTYENVISRRGASSESGKRLAARQITIEASILREPAKAVIPEPIATFLDALVSSPEFGDRVPTIRDMYLKPDDRTANEQLLDANAWSRGLGGALGYTRGPQALMPTNVSWLQPNGTPFP